MGFNPAVIPVVIWRCPICHAEETLRHSATGIIVRRHTIRCDRCGAVWENATGRGMMLTNGPREHQGYKTLDEWAAMASGPIEVRARDDIQVPMVLRPGEGVVLFGHAELYEERARRVPLGGTTYTGVSVRVAKGVRLHLGSASQREYRTVTEDRVVDAGELILTNQRLVFNGNKKPVNMDLTKVFAVDVEGGLLEIGYGSKTYRLRIVGGSPLRWQTYIRGVAQTVMERKSRGRTTAGN